MLHAHNYTIIALSPDNWEERRLRKVCKHFTLGESSISNISGHVSVTVVVILQASVTTCFSYAPSDTEHVGSIIIMLTDARLHRGQPPPCPNHMGQFAI